MPDFAALKQAGAAPEELDFSGSNDPYNLPEYAAEDYGLTAAQCAPPPAPTEHDLVAQGFKVQQDLGGPIVWTTPPKNGTDPMNVVTRDPAPLGVAPPTPDSPAHPSQAEGPPPAAESTLQAQKQAIDTAASVATAGISAMVNPNGASLAGLGGALGSALGIPYAGEAAALAGKVAGMLEAGGLDALGDPFAMAGNLTDVLGALGIPVPPALNAAIGEAKKIADALKQSVPPNGVPGVYAEKQFIARMGVSMTTHGTPLAPGPGAVNVLCMGTPVWRAIMDFHMCPIVKGVVPDVGGFVMPPTQFTVWALGAPVARHQADKVLEIPGGPNPIVPMTQAERAAEEKRKKEEEERKRREEEERKKRERQAKPDTAAPAPTTGQLSGGASGSPGSAPKVTTGLGKDVDEQISKSPKFTKKIEDLQKDGWTMKYGPAGGGTYADRTTKTITVDLNESGHPESVLESLAHEGGHAGYTPDPYVSPEGLSRKDYVDANVRSNLKDEGEATLTNIELRDDLAKNGGPTIGVAGAQSKKYEQIAQQYPNAQDRDKAREAIGNIYAHGEHPSNDPKKTYHDYYSKTYKDFYDKNKK